MRSGGCGLFTCSEQIEESLAERDGEGLALYEIHSLAAHPEDGHSPTHHGATQSSGSRSKHPT